MEFSTSRRSNGWLILKTAAVLFAPLWCLTSTNAADWPFWRGPTRDGVSQYASGWNEGTWVEDEPAWSIQVGEGSSSPIVVDGCVYVSGWREGKDRLQCIDLQSGATIWSQAYDAPRYGRLATGDQGLFGGPTSTPEYDPESKWIYTLSADGSLRCWDSSDEGRPVWNVSLYDSFTIPQRPRVGRRGLRDYGYTTSPLIWNEWVIVEAGATEGTIIAFDKQNGEEVWRSEANDPAGHTGGLVLLNIDDVPCVAILTHTRLLVVRIDSGQEGKTVASVPWETEFANNIATVASFENKVIVTSAYNQAKMACFELSMNRGAELIWEVPLMSKICSPVIKNGYVYWVWRQATCIRLEDGEVVWEGGSFGDAGSIVATTDNRLILWVGNGELLLVNDATRSPEALQVVAEKRRISRTDAWPHVVLTNESILCKDRAGKVWCFRKS